jgi:DNA-binding response OmpR family regulator
MPGMDGFEAADRIREVAPSAEILFLSQHGSLEAVREALRHGGRGYVAKSTASKDLIAAVRTVGRKKRYASPRFARALQKFYGDKRLLLLLANVVNGADVGLIQRRGCLRFAPISGLDVTVDDDDTWLVSPDAPFLHVKMSDTMLG